MKHAAITPIAILVMVLAACTQPTPEIVKETVIVTQPPLPTYTPYPTGTPLKPLPTYTPYPTYTPPMPLPTYTLPPTPTATTTMTPMPADTPTPTPTWTPVAQPTTTPIPTSSPVAVIADWRGEYYGNRDLSGTPVLVRNDVSVDFNWGSDAPATSVPTDGFSARWTRHVEFEAATYRFHTLADDGVRLWVDGNLLINAWYDSRLYSGVVDYSMVKGAHSVEVEYFEHTGEALIHLWWEKVVSPSFPNWKAEYYPNRDLSGDPALVRNEQKIDSYWGEYAPAWGLPADNFSSRWSRQATFTAGVYRFSAVADDGILIYVDDKVILGQWHDNPGDEVYLVDLSLTGEYQLMVEYYEHTGRAQVKVWWKRMSSLPTP